MKPTERRSREHPADAGVADPATPSEAAMWE